VGVKGKEGERTVFFFQLGRFLEGLGDAVTFRLFFIRNPDSGSGPGGSRGRRREKKSRVNSRRCSATQGGEGT